MPDQKGCSTAPVKRHVPGAFIAPVRAHSPPRSAASRRPGRGGRAARSTARCPTRRARPCCRGPWLLPAAHLRVCVCVCVQCARKKACLRVLCEHVCIVVVGFGVCGWGCGGCVRAAAATVIHCCVCVCCVFVCALQCAQFAHRDLAILYGPRSCCTG